MGRDLQTGDVSAPPDDGWWTQVAAALPESLTEPGAVEKMKTMAKVYKSSQMLIQVTLEGGLIDGLPRLI